MLSELRDSIYLLEADGLVSRGMCEEDRRSVFTCLTDKGLDLYNAARPTQREVLRTEGGECLAAVGTAFVATGALPR